MKKIIFNTDSLIMGGAERLAIGYANELSKYYEVLLLINENNGIQGNVLEKEISSRIKYQYVIDDEIIFKINRYREKKKENKYNIFYKILYNYYLKKRRKSYKKNIEKIIKNQKYDILIDFCCKIPQSICDNRTISWIHLTLKDLALKKRKIYREKFKETNKIIVINNDMKKEFINYFPEYIDKVEMIYNFFNIDEIKKLSEDKKELLTSEENLIKQKYILACCRLDKQKDLETLIMAFKILKEKDKIQEKLYIIGDGDKKEELKSLVHENKLEKEIIFLGTKLNPFLWMKNAQLFVHSTHKEGFGMVIVEAMIANGLVISSDCPVGPREILENGKSGILVKMQNIDEMRKAIKTLLKDTELQLQKRKLAKERVKDFSIEFNYKKLKDIIERI